MKVTWLTVAMVTKNHLKKVLKSYLSKNIVYGAENISRSSSCQVTSLYQFWCVKLWAVWRYECLKWKYLVLISMATETVRHNRHPTDGRPWALLYDCIVVCSLNSSPFSLEVVKHSVLRWNCPHLPWTAMSYLSEYLAQILYSNGIGKNSV
jgi:hypothetical protein